MRAAVLFIAAVTLFRVVMLAFNGTDLFVDEVQYWAWGQNLDWGYFSKPPMIGWVIRTVTDIAGSDAPFWVRVAAPVFHGAAALAVIWAALAWVDRWVAAWAGAIYVAMPLVTIGSALISTDTMLLPFFALAVGFYGRLILTPSAMFAVGLGVCVGLGLMSKYAMIYFVLGAVLVWLLQPAQRIRLTDAAIAAVFALAVFAPNIWWNIANDGQTVRHIVEDNAAWNGFALNWSGTAQFLAEQFLAFGPILMGVVLYQLWPALRGRLCGAALSLFLLSVPIILLVMGQALISRAYGNWAATAYVAAPMLAAYLLQNRRGLLVVSMAINLGIAVALPVLLAFPTAVTDAKGKPLLNRYLGLDEVSQIAGDLARAEGLDVITTGGRALTADMLYTLDGSGLDVRAWVGTAQPVASWYEAEFPITRPTPRDAAYLGPRPPAKCDGATRIGPVDPGFGYWSGRGLALWRLPAGC